MNKINISKGLMTSGIIYASTLLVEVLMQIFSLGSSMGNSIIMIVYLISLVIKPLSLISLIIFGCKALSIILRACSILIDKNNKA